MNYADIKLRLADKVPSELISTRHQGGAEIHYISVTDYKDLLDERAGVWTSEVRDFKQIGNAICVVVRINIIADDGIFSQDGTGLETLDTNSYGDFFSNSYAQAFRRACEAHGLSRELWKKDHSHAPQQRPQARSATASANRPQGFNPSGGITENQSKAIYAISKNKGVDEAAVIERIFPGKIKGELSAKEASEVIEKLNAV